MFGMTNGKTMMMLNYTRKQAEPTHKHALLVAKAEVLGKYEQEIRAALPQAKIVRIDSADQIGLAFAEATTEPTIFLVAKPATH